MGKENRSRKLLLHVLPVFYLTRKPDTFLFQKKEIKKRNEKERRDCELAKRGGVKKKGKNGEIKS